MLHDRCFTASSSSSTGPSPAQYEAIRKFLLESPQSPQAIERHPRSHTYEVRNAQVRIARACAGFSWVSEFGECGDTRCGCYRLWRPDVRRRFRENVVRCTVEQLGASGQVRYVTVGSGSLLTDFEILCALRASGLTIASIVAVDTCYDFGKEDGAAPAKALRQLGEFFGPMCAVYAFASLERFTSACVRWSRSLDLWVLSLARCLSSSHTSCSP